MKDCAGKILIIVQNLPVPFDRRVWLEATTLQQAGYRVSVISPRGNYARHEVNRGVSIYRYKAPTNAMGFFGYALEFVYCWMMTFYLSLKVWQREGFDVIHACNPPETFWLLGLFYSMFGKKFVFDHHDLSPEMYLARYKNPNLLLYKILLLFERITYKIACVVLVTNESIKKIAIERGRVEPEKVYIVRSGPDFERLQIKEPEDHLKNGRKYLACYLGEMCPQDGVDYLLESVRYIIKVKKQKDIQFILMGGGPALSGLVQLKEQMGLDGQVIFTGRISDEDLCRYLSTADLGLDPDPKTSWSDRSTMNKVMEYMTFAKPVVAFDLQETRFSAQQAAIYAQPNDVIDFANKIICLLKNPKKRSAMGQFGRQRIINELCWQRTCFPLLDAYKWVFKN